MIAGQWFINEVREKLEAMEKRIQGVLDRPVINDNEARDARIEKLEGEIRAMKARMGKKD